MPCSCFVTVSYYIYRRSVNVSGKLNAGRSFFVAADGGLNLYWMAPPAMGYKNKKNENMNMDIACDL